MRIQIKHQPLQERLIKLAEEAGVSPSSFIAHMIARLPDPQPKQSN